MSIERRPAYQCHGGAQRGTAGTLDDPADAGRIQRPGDERVRIYGTDGQDQVLHVPLPAGELPERMQVLCTFANDDGAGSDTCNCRIVVPAASPLAIECSSTRAPPCATSDPPPAKMNCTPE